MVEDTQSEIDVALEFVRYVNKHLSIDKFALEEECRTHAEFYSEVGLAAVQARSAAKKAKDQLDYTKVQVEGLIRAEPDKYGLVKTTEGAISSAVLLSDEVQLVLNEYRNREEIADTLTILQGSVEQRKTMLRDLVNLFVHSYYSEIDGKGVSTRETQAIQEAQIQEARENRHRNNEDES